MHILVKNNLENIYEHLLSFESILKNFQKNNINHLSMNEKVYYKEFKNNQDIIKQTLNIGHCDIISSFEYKPALHYLNEKGEKVDPKTIYHKIFVIEKLTGFNILQIANFVYSRNGIILTYDSEIYKKIEKAKEIKKAAKSYEAKKEEIENKYQKDLKQYEQELEVYKEKMQEYRKIKKEIEKFNREETKKAKKENRKPILKTLEIKKPIKPIKPTKEHLKLPTILDNLFLKHELESILISFLFKIKEIDYNFFLLIPIKEFNENIFKRKNLKELNTSIETISFDEILDLFKRKIEEENHEYEYEYEKNKNLKFFLQTPYTYGTSSFRIVIDDALAAFIELQSRKEKWDILENYANISQEKELPILTTLKPNQTASMLAGGIGNFAKEIEINGEKQLIKGAIIKEKIKREISVNNMVIEETIESYTQEIGVLNISRRELTIIK